MKVVVTGGAGFIGANLVRSLCNRPDVKDVVVVDDLSFGFRSNLDDLDVTFLKGSILDKHLVAEAIDGASSVVHLAARSSVPRSIAHPMAAHEDNTTGTAIILEAARSEGNIQVIVASSSSVYGANETLPKHEGLAPRPVSPYAATKLATESYTLAWSHSYAVPVLALRFFNIFGPLQPPLHAYAAAIPSFLAAAFTGQPLPVHGDGSQSRDFTYVASVVEIITDAVLRRVSHLEPVNLAFGTSVSLLDVIALMEDVIGRRLPIENLPLRVGDVPRSQADSSALLGLFPDVEPTPLRVGLTETVRWFEQARPWDRLSQD